MERQIDAATTVNHEQMDDILTRVLQWRPEVPFELIEKPVAGADAFQDTTDAGLLSQAAILLCVGAHIRRKAEVLPEEASVLTVPPVSRHLGGKETFLDPAIVRGTMTRQLGERSFPADVNEPVKGTVSAEIFETMAKKPDPVWTAGLLESCLRHTEEIVRVAAAAAYHPFTTEKERILGILAEGTRSDEPLVSSLAATALAQASPDHARLRGLTVRLRAATAGGESHTTLLVHGTYARQAPWWQPRGDFHSYLSELLPTLSRTPPWSAPYAAADRFDWSGNYTDEARADAARALVDWVSSHAAEGLDLIAHSYGGDVVMLATKLGMNAREIVLLSVPALPAKYFPDFTRVRGRVVSFRVHMDLVLLADAFVSGADSRFHKPIVENVLSLWFDHSATHSPEVWGNPEYDIPPRI